MSSHVESLFSFLFAMLLLGMLVEIVSASGQVDYCYIERYPQGIVVFQHRSYRFDRQTVTVQTIAEAKKATEELGCELK